MPRGRAGPARGIPGSDGDARSDRRLGNRSGAGLRRRRHGDRGMAAAGPDAGPCRTGPPCRPGRVSCCSARTGRSRPGTMSTELAASESGTSRSAVPALADSTWGRFVRGCSGRRWPSRSPRAGCATSAGRSGCGPSSRPGTGCSPSPASLVILSGCGAAAKHADHLRDPRRRDARRDGVADGRAAVLRHRLTDDRRAARTVRGSRSSACCSCWRSVGPGRCAAPASAVAGLVRRRRR